MQRTLGISLVFVDTNAGIAYRHNDIFWAQPRNPQKEVGVKKGNSIIEGEVDGLINKTSTCD